MYTPLTVFFNNYCSSKDSIKGGPTYLRTGTDLSIDYSLSSLKLGSS